MTMSDQHKGDSVESIDLPEDAIIIGPGTETDTKTDTDKGKLLQVTLDGENIELQVDGQQSILECLIDKGYNPPYSCMEGACLTCLAEVTEGAVYQNDPGILTDEDIKDNKTLTCQCRPLSSLVKIHYNQL